MRRSTDRNVLFVIVDDLRQQLAHTSPLEGEDTSFMVTPVLDGLAREAVSFRRAHVQIAVCAPSRSSVAQQWMAPLAVPRPQLLRADKP